jgi:flavin reductase (DIM6/NTAB) family NADH-FMN oxidoreductase RutF
MKTISFSEISVPQKHAWLNHAIAPRPIAFVSTVDKNGAVNLSPFSYCNIVSVNPSIIVFSTLIKPKNNSFKDTLLNVMEVPEAVINICDYDMVQQVSLSSCGFNRETDEFIKAGFTKQPATLVSVPMVQEAKIKLECKIIEIKSLGDKAGAGQLIFCEVLYIHADENILNEDGTMIDQLKIHHIARMGSDWYCKTDATNIFHVNKPTTEIAIGVDALPDGIRNSKILTGNNLGMLANVTAIPEIDPAFTDDILKNILQYYSINPDEMEKELHCYAKILLDKGDINAAWQVLLADENA